LAATSFTGFYVLDIAAGAQFIDTGAAGIVTAQTLDAAGTLALGAAGAAGIVNAGLIETTGAGMLTLAGTVTNAGLSKAGGTSLDLADISFVSATEATYSGTKTGGVLTVTDGTHTAHINLKGNYLTSTFVASSDGHGGTIVVDPKAKGAASPLTAGTHGFVAAMAGFAGPATAPPVDRGGAEPGRLVTLALPRVAVA
jgi:hypothetical protein